MTVGPITKVVVGGYLVLIALAVVATVTTEGDGDGLEYLALEVVALPWTVALAVAGTPDSVYPWLLTVGALLNAALLFVAGRALGQRRARKAGHSSVGA